MATVLPAGATITCENGHRICVTNHELVASPDRPMARSEWFVDFEPQHYVPVPHDGYDVCVCGICGAPWVDERPGVLPDGTRVANIAKLHTDKGWWP